VELVNYVVICFSYDHKSEKMFYKHVSDNSSALSLRCEMTFYVVPYKVFIQDPFCSRYEENACVTPRITERAPVLDVGIARHHVRPIQFCIDDAVPALWR
jgi:hypothetical protein